LFGYGIEKIFGKQTTAFEIGGQYVQTSVPGDAAPQAIGKAAVEPDANVDVYNPSLVCTRPDTVPVRHGIQIGFNPFTPVVSKGAEEFIKMVGYDPVGDDQRY